GQYGRFRKHSSTLSSTSASRGAHRENSLRSFLFLLRWKHVAALCRAITGGKPLFVEAEKWRFAHAVPECGAVGAERFDFVGIGGKHQTLAERRRQPMRERAPDARRQRQHALAPEHAVGFLIVRIRIVAG